MLEHRWLAMLYQFQVYCKLIHLYIYWHRDLLSFKFFPPLGYYRMLNSLVSVWSLLSLKYRYMFPFKWRFWNNWRELTAPPLWHVFLLEQWLQDGVWVSCNRQWVPRMGFQPPPAWSSGPALCLAYHAFIGHFQGDRVPLESLLPSSPVFFFIFGHAAQHVGSYSWTKDCICTSFTGSI